MDDLIKAVINNLISGGILYLLAYMGYRRFVERFEVNESAIKQGQESIRDLYDKYNNHETRVSRMEGRHENRNRN